jgi:hypothetical protein
MVLRYCTGLQWGIGRGFLWGSCSDPGSSCHGWVTWLWRCQLRTPAKGGQGCSHDCQGEIRCFRSRRPLAIRSKTDGVLHEDNIRKLLPSWPGSFLLLTWSWKETRNSAEARRGHRGSTVRSRLPTEDAKTEPLGLAPHYFGPSDSVLRMRVVFGDESS